MPGYDHSVPSGQRLSTPAHEFGATSPNGAIEDEDSDSTELAEVLPDEALRSAVGSSFAERSREHDAITATVGSNY